MAKNFFGAQFTKHIVSNIVEQGRFFYLIHKRFKFTANI